MVSTCFQKYYRVKTFVTTQQVFHLITVFMKVFMVTTHTHTFYWSGNSQAIKGTPPHHFPPRLAMWKGKIQNFAQCSIVLKRIFPLLADNKAMNSSGQPPSPPLSPFQQEDCAISRSFSKRPSPPPPSPLLPPPSPFGFVFLTRPRPNCPLFVACVFTHTTTARAAYTVGQIDLSTRSSKRASKIFC